MLTSSKVARRRGLQCPRREVRNNSAWNHRHYVLEHFGISPEVARQEVDFALAMLGRAPHNEAAWNYLRSCALLLSPLLALMEIDHTSQIPRTRRCLGR